MILNRTRSYDFKPNLLHSVQLPLLIRFLIRTCVPTLPSMALINALKQFIEVVAKFGLPILTV